MKNTSNIKLNNISRLAHDIRSSLTSVREGISLVNDGTMGEINRKQKKCLKIAEKGIAKIVNLIDHFSRVENKRRAR
ncbi:MAG: hypothetical protein Q8K15_03895 [Candidatus Omnitrophota bacterium]|nr:hypothetical protein [Candidatus Omnitrophota bacterium]